jgi:hypothetical protein
VKPLAFTEVLELGGSSAQLFEHMTHPDTAPTIDPTIVEWRADDYPPKVGTHNRLRVKLGPLKLRTVSRFIECDPPRRMVIRGVSPPMTRWTTGIHDLEDIPGGMRYAYTIEMAPPFGFRTLSRLVLRMMHRGVLEGCGRLVATFGPPHV